MRWSWHQGLDSWQSQIWYWTKFWVICDVKLKISNFLSWFACIFCMLSARTVCTTLGFVTLIAITKFNIISVRRHLSYYFYLSLLGTEIKNLINIWIWCVPYIARVKCEGWFDEKSFVCQKISRCKLQLRTEGIDNKVLAKISSPVATCPSG